MHAKASPVPRRRKIPRTQAESTETIYKFRQESHLGRKVETRSSLDSGNIGLVLRSSADERWKWRRMRFYGRRAFCSSRFEKSQPLDPELPRNADCYIDLYRALHPF